MKWFSKTHIHISFNKNLAFGSVIIYKKMFEVSQRSNQLFNLNLGYKILPRLYYESILFIITSASKFYATCLSNVGPPQKYLTYYASEASNFFPTQYLGIKSLFVTCNLKKKQVKEITQTYKENQKSF